MGSTKGKTKKKAKSSGRTKGGASKRSSAFEMDRRVEYAEGLLASGVRHNTAVDHLKEKYSVCRCQAERYVDAVYHLWRGQEDEDRRLKRKRARARRQEVFLRSLKKNDHTSANKALDVLERMEGIAPEQVMKHEHTGEVTQKHEAGQSLIGALKDVMSDAGKRKTLAGKLAPSREEIADAPLNPKC